MESKDIFSYKVLQTIFYHAEHTYPEECCGFIFADTQVHCGVNIQNQLNEKNPKIYQRNAANGYTFSMADTLLLNQSLKSDNPAQVIYHSHPDVGAYFSKEDKDKALFVGELIYPVSYLVVDVCNGEAKGAKLFEWNNENFICSRDFSAFINN